MLFERGDDGFGGVRQPDVFGATRYNYVNPESRYEEEIRRRRQRDMGYYKTFIKDSLAPTGSRYDGVGTGARKRARSYDDILMDNQPVIGDRRGTTSREPFRNIHGDGYYDDLYRYYRNRDRNPYYSSKPDYNNRYPYYYPGYLPRRPDPTKYVDKALFENLLKEFAEFKKQVRDKLNGGINPTPAPNPSPSPDPNNKGPTNEELQRQVDALKALVSQQDEQIKHLEERLESGGGDPQPEPYNNENQTTINRLREENEDLQLQLARMIKTVDELQDLVNQKDPNYTFEQNDLDCVDELNVEGAPTGDLQIS